VPVIKKRNSDEHGECEKGKKSELPSIEIGTMSSRPRHNEFLNISKAVQYDQCRCAKHAADPEKITLSQAPHHRNQ
jgi:hypothetical protein